MTALVPKGRSAVMASRVEPPDSLDYFPTPPWATRAVLDLLEALDPLVGDHSCWEPACGEGHMAAVLLERFSTVDASDVFDYGFGYVADFLDADARAELANGDPDWIVTNPPFKTALEFAHVGLKRARVGVALLVRTSWLEGGARYDELFHDWPPAMIVQYAERVPMTKGRWDPSASTATSYCWVIWRRNDHTGSWPAESWQTRFVWIPPGQRKAMARPEDLRFAVQAEGALL